MLVQGKARAHVRFTILAFIAVSLFVVPSTAAIIQEDALGWRISVPDWAITLGASTVVHDEDPNTLVLEISKVFTGELDKRGYLPSLFMNFTQVQPDESTAKKIVIADESIQNNTAEDWWDFHWYLITYGVASFNKAETFPSEHAQPGDDFSLAPFTQHAWSQQGTGVGMIEELSAYGGAVAKGDMFNPGGGPGGGDLVIDAQVGQTEEPAFFVLKELPTIPEPAVVALLSAGALTLLRRRR